MINEPWRIGPEDYVRASGLETEFDERKHRPLAADTRAHWFESFTHLKQEWRTRVIVAFDGGVITLETDGLHADARGLIHTEVNARRKRIEATRRAELEATNTYDTVDQLNVGDRPWCRRFGERVQVIRKHRVAVEVKTSRGNIFPIDLRSRSLRRLSPKEIDAEVRKTMLQTSAPASASAPAPVPTPTERPTETEQSAVAEPTGSEIVKSEKEGTQSPLSKIEHSFEGRNIPAVQIAGREGYWWPARYVGRAIDQGDDGKRFVRNATEDGVEGVDFVRIEGDALAAVRSLVADEGAESAPSQNHERNQDAAGRAMVLLSESGLNLALMRSRTEVGKRMRVWLARDVMPSIRRSGSYSVAGAPAAASTGLSVESVKEIVASAIGAFVEPVLKTVEVQMNALRQEMRERDQRTPPALPAAPPVDASTDLTAGTRHAREITGRITKAAHIAVASGLGTFGKTRKQFEDRVRSAIGFPRASAHRWENLPMCRLGEARLAVAQIESEVQASAEKHFRASQLRLIPGGATT